MIIQLLPTTYIIDFQVSEKVDVFLAKSGPTPSKPAAAKLVEGSAKSDYSSQPAMPQCHDVPPLNKRAPRGIPPKQPPTAEYKVEFNLQVWSCIEFKFSINSLRLFVDII